MGPHFLTCFPFLTDDDEMEGDGVIDPGMEYVPPPAGVATSGTGLGGRKKVRAPEQIKQEVESEEEKPDEQWRETGR